VSTRNWRAVVVLAVVAVATAALSAQRGGGGRNERPLNRTSYESAEYGVKFPVPGNMDLYTPDEPGIYRRVFTAGRSVFIVNPQNTEETIGIKVSAGATDAELASYKAALESHPPQAKLPGFAKVAVGDVTIGKGGGKQALNFVYRVTQDRMEMTVRQVVFIHNGRGFTVTCESLQKRFEKIDHDVFDPFLAKFEFK
jgi:hypothetical protein